MKAIKFLSLVVIASLLLFTTSCTQDSLESENDKATDFSINLLENGRSNYENYQINTNTSINPIDNTINIEFPVAADDFKHLKTYNISTKDQPALIYLISRNNTESIVDLPSTHLVKAQVNLDEINMDMNLVENSKGLTIIVMNNANLLNSNHDNMIKCLQEDMADYKINSTCTIETRSADGPLVRGGGIVIR